MSHRHATPDTVECGACQARFPLRHFRLGMSLPCPVCGRESVPKLVFYGFHWYDVTFGDFRRLLLDVDTRDSTAHRVLAWLGWTLDVRGDEASFVGADGRRHPLEAAHLLIQHNAEWQFDLYQMAMSFWR